MLSYNERSSIVTAISYAYFAYESIDGKIQFHKTRRLEIQMLNSKLQICVDYAVCLGQKGQVHNLPRTKNMP